jgi:hypothetical protein
MNFMARFLGDFAKLRKETINSPSFIRQIFTKFHISVFYQKTFVENIQVSLKSGKNEGYLTWRPIYSGDIISLSSC